MLHNRYKFAGGEDVSTRADATILRDAGIACDLVEVDNETIDRGNIGVAVNATWSRRSYRTVEALVCDKGYDIVHVQNFFPQLSPAVHWAASRNGAAVIQTIRNYRLSCVNGLFFRDGKPCELCLGRSPLNGVVHACYQDSRLASTAVASMLVAHRALGTWRRRVDRFIALSRFSRSKLVASDIPAQRIVVRPNFLLDAPATIDARPGKHFLYVGRLSKEKGLETLLSAFALVGSPAARLVVVGDGPLRPDLVAAAANDPRIAALGHLDPARIAELIRDAIAVVVPSECYETFGRVIIETFACGRPVIVSDLGAVGELVDPGVDGLKAPAGSPPHLAAAIEEVEARRDELEGWGQNARRKYEAHFSQEAGLGSLLEIYRSALHERARMRPDVALRAGSPA